MGSPLKPTQQKPWSRQLGLTHVLEEWAHKSQVVSNLALVHEMSAKEASCKPFPLNLPNPIKGALRGRGIEELYSHQWEALDALAQGQDVVVATPTASGKSLCYNLPVLRELSQEPDARALYLFPTKALSRDQELAVRSLMNDAKLHHAVVTYDGDTPGDVRRAAREKSGILITNPDMLHTGILPHHASWARFFANLKFVVVDELHMYRGVFGSHLANVLRRLERIAKFHGSSPKFICSSATIGNPQEHASAMTGRRVRSIEQNGAPQGPRQVLLYNPPVINAELGMRQSYLKTAVRLTADLVRADVPTLVFGQSRNGVEVMLKYLRDRLVPEGIDPKTIQGYRGGYLPKVRREIEEGLREGKVRCVVATNALELGIDIGGLDAVVCAGYPGSIAGLWQRFGRAGRRGEGSLALLVTSSAPLDQYLAQASDYVIGAPIEQARIDPDNVEILVQHLKCAAFELPFEQGEAFRDVPADVVSDALEYLEGSHLVHRVTDEQGQSAYHWSSDSYPANHVSLRNVGWDNFVVIDQENERTIAETDFRSAHTMLHEQAIYQLSGQQFQVEKLDYDNHKAFVRKVEPDYYTLAHTHVNVTVLDEEEKSPIGFGGPCTWDAGVGEVSVIEKVVGYKKIKFHTHENVGYGDVRLPEMQMHTSAFWLTVPKEMVDQMEHPRATVVDALRALGHALHTVSVVGLMVDPHDIGKAMGDGTDADSPGSSSARGQDFDPTIYLYDHVAGGIGLSPRLYEQREELLMRAYRLLRACPCDLGCPTCIGPAQLGVVGSPTTEADLVSRKHVALELLGQLGLVEH